MIKYEWRTSLDPQEAAELADLLDRAGNQASGSRAALVSFQLDGNTYVVLDTHPASDVFGDTDTGITLTGLVDVQWSDFACVVVV